MKILFSVAIGMVLIVIAFTLGYKEGQKHGNSGIEMTINGQVNGVSNSTKQPSPFDEESAGVEQIDVRSVYNIKVVLAKGDTQTLQQGKPFILDKNFRLKDFQNWKNGIEQGRKAQAKWKAEEEKKKRELQDSDMNITMEEN